jgi:hypothetical protein
MNGWCARRESNPHVFRHWNLNPARLPVPPRARGTPCPDEPSAMLERGYSKDRRRGNRLRPSRVLLGERTFPWQHHHPKLRNRSSPSRRSPGNPRPPLRSSRRSSRTSTFRRRAPTRRRAPPSRSGSLRLARRGAMAVRVRSCTAIFIFWLFWRSHRLNSRPALQLGPKLERALSYRRQIGPIMESTRLRLAEKVRRGASPPSCWSAPTENRKSAAS